MQLKAAGNERSERTVLDSGGRKAWKGPLLRAEIYCPEAGRNERCNEVNKDEKSREHGPDDLGVGSPVAARNWDALNA